MNVDLTGKRIALIGGAGFIGHNLALKLISLGADVHVFDRLQVNNLGAFSNVVNDPLKLLYLHLINERIELMRKNSIPLHVLDARDYQMLSRVRYRKLSRRLSCNSPRSRMLTARTRTLSAPSIIASARLKTRSTARAVPPALHLFLLLHGIRQF